MRWASTWERPTGGSSSDESRFFGSTDHSLMRKCPVPVWLLDPGRSARFRTVLAAVDVAGPHAEELNARIVQMASSLAAREGASFHVVHAWQLYGESLLRSHRTELSRRRLRELLRQEERERRTRIEALLEREAEGREPRTEVHKGVPSRVITKVAKKGRADVLVMGAVTHAWHTGAPHRQYGRDGARSHPVRCPDAQARPLPHPDRARAPRPGDGHRRRRRRPR